MAIFHDWCNQNELRNYPLADLASKKDAQGRRLPDDFLVDVNLWVPESAGTRVAVSSAAITPGLVTMTFSADGGGTPVPVAAVAVTKPVTRYRKYQVQAYYPGVGGWVAFGSAVEEHDDLALVFDNFDAAVLVPHVSRSYDDLPLLSIGKKDRAQALTGLVTLRGGDDVEVLACTDDWPVGSDPDYLDNPRYKREINGEPRSCIAIRLIGDPGDYENLYTYAGPCDKSPDSFQCGRRLIQKINGVVPDCEGNIDVEFKNIPAGHIVDDTGKTVGLALNYPLGLTDVCEEKLPFRDTPDLCESSSLISSLSSLSISSSSVSSISSISSSGIPECPDITGSYIETFDGDLRCWDRWYGSWWLDNCQLIGESTSGWGITTLQNTYTLGRDLQAFINIWTTGVEQRAYLIFGFEDSSHFWFLELNAGLNRIIIGRRNGPQVIEESLPLWTTVPTDTYIHVRVSVSVGGNIQTWIDGSPGPTVTAVPGTLEDGFVGFATRQSTAKFDNLAFDWWTTDPAQFPQFGCYSSSSMSAAMSMSSLSLSSSSSVSVSSESLVSISSSSSLFSSSSYVPPASPAVFSAHMDLDVSSQRHGGCTTLTTNNATGSVIFNRAVKRWGTTAADFTNTGNAKIFFDTSSDWTLGTDNFTIECEVNFYAGVSSPQILAQCNESASNYWVFFYDPTGGRLYFSGWNGSDTLYVSGPWNPSSNTWNHVAAVRSGSTFYLFVNGTDILDDITGPTTISFDPTADLEVGQGQYRMDELRISNTARHTGNYSPPTGPYEDDAFTRLLCHFDMESTGRHDLEFYFDTLEPDERIDFSRKRKYGTLALDPAVADVDNRIWTDASNVQDWAIGSGDSYTIECWVRMDALLDESFFLGADTKIGGSDFLWRLRYHPTQGLVFEASYDGAPPGVYNNFYQGTTAGWVTNSWIHVAVVYDADSFGIVRTYVNGQLAAQLIPSTWETGAAAAACKLRIGRWSDSFGCTGKIDEVFITREALYTGISFSPPSGPHSP